MGLHVSQGFHFVETEYVHKTRFQREHRVLAHLTSFLPKKRFKRKEMLV